MYIGLHVKYLIFLLDFQETWVFSIRVPKFSQISNYTKIRAVEVRVVPCRRTIMTLITAFRNFTNAPAEFLTLTSDSSKSSRALSTQSTRAMTVKRRSLNARETNCSFEERMVHGSQRQSGQGNKEKNPCPHQKPKPVRPALWIVT
jgi:hypothetical protein